MIKPLDERQKERQEGKHLTRYTKDDTPKTKDQKPKTTRRKTTRRKTKDE